MKKSTFTRRSIALAMCTVLLMLGGCATSAHYAMSPEAAAQLKSVDVTVGIEQREINPTVMASTGGAGFGLIGALIDAGITNSRATEAEELIQPLRNALLDYNFDAVALSEYAARMDDVPLLAGVDPVLVKGPLTEPYEAALKSSKADAVLFLTTDYVTSSDFSQITVGLQASMFPGRAELDAFRDSGKAPRPNASPLMLSDAMYRNAFTVTAKLPQKGAGPTGNINAWAADNGTLARAAMDKAIRRLAMMLALDIQQVQGQVAGMKGQTTHKVNNRPVRVAYEEGGVTLYRFSNGAMTSEVVLAR